MKVAFNALFWIIFPFGLVAQIPNSPSAIIAFDGTTEELISGIIPDEKGNYTYVPDRNGVPNSAIQFSGILDYGNPAFSRMDSTDFSICFWFRKDGSLWQEKSIIEKKSIGQFSSFYETYGLFYNDWVGAGSVQIRFKPSFSGNMVSTAMAPLQDD